MNLWQGLVLPHWLPRSPAWLWDFCLGFLSLKVGQTPVPPAFHPPASLFMSMLMGLCRLAQLPDASQRATWSRFPSWNVYGAREPNRNNIHLVDWSQTLRSFTACPLMGSLCLAGSCHSSPAKAGSEMGEKKAGGLWGDHTLSPGEAPSQFLFTPSCNQIHLLDGTL